MPTPATRLSLTWSRTLCAATLSTLLVGAAQAQAPVVSSVSPARHAQTAPRATSVAFRFDQPLSNTAPTRGALRVFSQQAGGQQAGTATVSGNTLTFDPTTDFKPGETVAATLTTAVQSSSGQALSRAQVLKFTTATSSSSGLFGGGSEVSVARAPSRVVLGDVDGDGDLDLVTGNANGIPAQSVSVRLNDGAGNFSGGSEVDVAFTISDLRLADLDGDGDLDLVASEDSNGSSVVVRFNEGTGTFSGGQRIAVGNGVKAIDLGDLDGDGDLDLAAYNYLPGTVSLRFNNGAGGFSGSQELTVAPVFSVAAAVSLDDVDQDGDLDVVTNYGTRLNTGNNVFAPVQTGIPNLAARAGQGDLDGDGDFDRLIPNPTTNSVTVYFNNGSNVFSAVQQVAVGVYPLALAVGDLNGDGALDFVTVNYGLNSAGTTVSVRLNQARSTAPVAYRLNAGGGALNTTRNLFAADQYYSDSSAVLVSAAPIAGTNNDGLYQTERYSTHGQLRYAVPVANGSYTVVLHFAELYWSQPGQRVFNIGLEGRTVRTNYDILTQVAPFTATTETFLVTVTDGVLNLDLRVPYLSGGRDQAKLSALEIIPILTSYKLNAGGPPLSTSLGEFAAETPGTYSGNTATAVTTAPIAGTSDDALYQSERYSTQGSLGYRLPVPNGRYTVVLHFAEIYWTQPGQRVFDIRLEGVTARANFDIVAKVGPLAATTETFQATVADGYLDLELVASYLTGGRDQAKLSALEVSNADGRPLASNATTSPGRGSALQAYPNPVTNGRFTLAYTAAQAQAGTLTLVDQLGRPVHEQAVALQAGPNQLVVQPTPVRAGLYQLVLRTADGQRSTHKVVMQP